MRRTTALAKLVSRAACSGASGPASGDPAHLQHKPQPSSAVALAASYASAGAWHTDLSSSPQ